MADASLAPLFRRVQTRDEICMNEEYWRLAGLDLPDSPGGGNGIQFAFRYNRRLLLSDEAQLDRDRTGD